MATDYWRTTSQKKADKKLDELSDDLKAKVLACKSPEELFALAKEEGYELSDDELTAISGGSSWGYCGDACSLAGEC